MKRIITNNKSPFIAQLAIVFCLFVLPSAATQKTQNAAAAPANTAAATASGEYIVGQADVLRINVWKEPELSEQSVIVRPDGMISMPLVGEIKVSGMTPSEIESMLVPKLKRFINDPLVTVTVVDIRSKIVYLTGEVAKPGEYALLAPTDVLQLITKAGGPTPFAHKKSIFVLREVNGKKQKFAVDYNQLIRGNHEEQNITLQPGDTVVIP